MPPRENPDYPRVLQTQQFIFLIGKDQTPMTIHTGLLEGLSAPLNAMINNGYMKESLEGVAVLEDVEPAIFAAFCEFAYTGTYTTPSRYASSAIKLPEDKDSADNHQLSRKRKRDLDDKDYKELQKEFDLLMTRNHNRRGFSDLGLDRPHPNPGCPDFLFGAKIYVFATQFLITPLRLHALKTLYTQLYSYFRRDGVQKYIIDLVRYTYDNTGSSEPGGQPFLRKLVMAYAARNVKFLNMRNELLNCCNENAELNSDVLEVVLKKRK